MTGMKHCCVLGSLAVFAATCAAASQDSKVETCRLSTSTAERIACLEEALTSESNGDGDAPRDTSETVEPVSREGAATKGSEGQLDENGARSTGKIEGIGARQIRLRNRTGDEVAQSLESASGLRVANYSEVPYQRLQIELENGQIWRQIAGDTQRLRVNLDRNQTVDIEESRISGYKLRLNELKRTLRVERVR